MRITKLLTVVNCFVMFSVFAQNLHFKELSVKDGLVSNMVHTTIQDSDGFMWFGTEDGLSRYDGYSFLNFFQSPTDTLSLSNNLVLSLAEDKNKHLWIGTHQGLNMLDLETYKVTRFNKFFKSNLGSFTIESLYVDDDVLWIGTDNSGLYRLDINTYKVKHYSHVPQNKNSISSNTINSFVKDPNRGLLIATSNGLDVFNDTNETFNHILKDINVSNLQIQSDGNVLLGLHSEAAYYLKLKDDFEFEKVQLPIDSSEKEVNVFCDSEDNLWISVRDFGLIYVDNKTQKSYRLLFDKNNLSGISSNTITDIFEDAFGNIWISSFDAGLNILDKKRKEFIHIKDNHLPNGLLNNRVRAIYQDSDEEIWIGTKVNGDLSKFNRDSLIFNHYQSNSLNPTSLSSDFVFCITEDKPGYLWVGTLDGLNLFNKNTGDFTIYKHQENNANSLSSNSVNALLKDKDTLFIGTVTSGLDIYNTSSKIFSHYKKTGESNQLSDDRIKVVYKDKRDNIWIGTINGLNLFDVKTGTFKQFLNNPLDSNSISENYILSIYEDEHKNLWIGTSLGINLMDRETGVFKAYTTKDGLAGNSVRGILEDDEGNLWLSTNNGLSKFNVKKKEFKNYNIYDGLQSNEFSPFVFCETTNGEMLFGGNYGFNLFHPDKILDNQIVPKVLITEFKISNKPVNFDEEDSPLTKHITKTKQIELTYKQSVFSFEFVALNYSTPEKSEYAYMMQGFDEDWNYIGNKREANYTNLNSGEYIFKVKASNNDGYWNEEGASIKITILPPPWKTWWAYTIYIILIFVLLWRFRHNAIKRNNQKKQRELNALKLNFFGNVSHEFRTPLTLILGPLEKLLNKKNNPEEEKHLLLISRHAKRLLGLVNQLLDFQKIGSGELQVNFSSGDLVLFVKEIFNEFIELSDDKNINLEFESEIKVCQANFDFDKTEKILFNLLSNAFKFTKGSGKISLKLSLKKQKKAVVIKVKDTGVGIPKNQLNTIFKRFYQVDDSALSNNQGTGIGLALTKEYVELLGGDISVESTLGEGTCFTVEIPLNMLGDIEMGLSKSKTITNVNSAIFQDELPNYNSKTPLVLLVEDNVDLRSFLKNSLQKTFKILEASNGEEGLKKALKHVPDIIVSDIMMPKMDGNVFCSSVKSDKRISHIPVILLTAQVSKENEMIGFKHGADQYITKPFNMDVLESRIESMLIQRQKLQSIFSKKIEVSPSEITITSVDEKLIQKALSLVEDNISNTKYSVDELSNSLEISRGHLYRKIVSITGRSPSEFIKSIKLKRGAQLLMSSKLTVSEIAYQVGFSNPKYFSKCFKIEFKVLPSEFASKYKK